MIKIAAGRRVRIIRHHGRALDGILRHDYEASDEGIHNGVSAEVDGLPRFIYDDLARVELHGIEQALDAIAYIRKHDCDFITPDTLCAYRSCTIEEARQAIVEVFGQDWLDDQDKALAAHEARKAGAA